MKVIISKTFQDDFEKIIWKEITKCNLILFTSLIHKFYLSKWFYLNRPFLKLKFDFCNKTSRLLTVYNKENDLIIPIFITDKNDKIYWYNMTWDIIKDKALVLFQKISQDIDNDNYTEF